jgi:hypothetical protein
MLCWHGTCSPAWTPDGGIAIGSTHSALRTGPSEWVDVGWTMRLTAVVDFRGSVAYSRRFARTCTAALRDHAVDFRLRDQDPLPDADGT